MVEVEEAVRVRNRALFSRGALVADAALKAAAVGDAGGDRRAQPLGDWQVE